MWPLRLPSSFLVDNMVQTRSQQAGDQSPLYVGGDTLWSVTVEVDAVAATMSSGLTDTLTHAISAPAHSANTMEHARR